MRPAVVLAVAPVEAVAVAVAAINHVEAIKLSVESNNSSCLPDRKLGDLAHRYDLKHFDLAEQEASPEIALAAIKYADLSGAIHKDYVFDAEWMVQTTGDTGPYLQYAHARICQILRRAEAENISWGAVAVLEDRRQIGRASCRERV